MIIYHSLKSFVKEFLFDKATVDITQINGFYALVFDET